MFGTVCVDGVMSGSLALSVGGGRRRSALESREERPDSNQSASLPDGLASPRTLEARGPGHTPDGPHHSEVPLEMAHLR